jgi:hypothetical protein
MTYTVYYRYELYAFEITVPKQLNRSSCFDYVNGSRCQLRDEHETAR